MIVDDCQRFTLGRESRRPAGELIRPAEYEVFPIASAADARAFVVAHHYAGDCSSTAHRFGLGHRGAMVGVACFGPPASMNAHRRVWPTLSIKEAVSLGRLVLLDEVPGNGESWFIARCFELLARRGIVGVESCADPQPRSSPSGEIVFRGHLGTVYCATNGRFIGRTNDSTLRLFPDGTCLSNRSLGKPIRGERGAERAIAQLVRWGATAPRLGEDLAGWIATWRGRLTRSMRHRGCYRYIWALDKRRRREILTAPALPYPKNPGFDRTRLSE
jgi:hypothetical protein